MTTSQVLLAKARCWTERIAQIVAAILAIAILASLLLGFSVIANVLHTTANLAIAADSVIRVPPLPSPGWNWPLTGHPEVIRRFAPPASPWLPGHRGVDLKGEAGAGVRAAGAGVVRYAGLIAGRGVVSVEHPNGLRTTYEPLDPMVQAGQPVNLGDQLGVLTAGHFPCDSACLHWGSRSGDNYLNPLALLARVRVRLLPLSGA